MPDCLKQCIITRLLQPVHRNRILGILGLVGLNHSICSDNSLAVQGEDSSSGLVFAQTVFDQSCFNLFCNANATGAGTMNEINLILDLLPFNFHGCKNGCQRYCSGSLDVVVE